MVMDRGTVENGAMLRDLAGSVSREMFHAAASASLLSLADSIPFYFTARRRCCSRSCDFSVCT